MSDMSDRRNYAIYVEYDLIIYKGGVCKVELKKPLDLEDVMTVSEIAVKLRVNSNTVLRWCKDGKFPNAYRAGKPWRVPKRDVDEYLLTLTNTLKRGDI